MYFTDSLSLKNKCKDIRSKSPKTTCKGNQLTNLGLPSGWEKGAGLLPRDCDPGESPICLLILPCWCQHHWAPFWNLPFRLLCHVVCPTETCPVLCLATPYSWQKSNPTHQCICRSQGQDSQHPSRGPATLISMLIVVNALPQQEGEHSLHREHLWRLSADFSGEILQV